MVELSGSHLTGDDVMAQTATGMCASLFLCSEYSVLLPNVINISRCNQNKQKLSEGSVTVKTESVPETKKFAKCDQEVCEVLL